MRKNVAIGTIASFMLPLLSISSLHAQPLAIGTAKVSVDQPGPKIDRNIFGQFAEQLGKGIYEGVWVGPDSSIPNIRGIRSDVVTALKALKVPNVRWPGGCFADQYNWRNGIGPAGKRPVTYNINWGNPVEPNSFGTDEFMDFVGQIGSEAYISVNVGSGSPREAAEWLEYLTTDKPTALGQERAANGHPKPYKVKFLGIGNETWDCGGNLSADAYVAELNRHLTFVKNLNPAQSGPLPRFMRGPDPMVRIAVGPPDTDTIYTEAVMKAYRSSARTGGNFEGLSLHHYTSGLQGSMMEPATGFAEQDWAQLVHNAYDMDRLIAQNSALMDKYDPKKQVALVVDEWGNWLKPLAGTPVLYIQQQNSIRDAVTAAINLNIFTRHADRVRMANIAQMVNVLQSMILTDGPKMILTPTYHVFRMYVPFQDATVLPIEVNAGRYVFEKIDLPRVDAIAARGTDGKIWLAMTNLDAGTAAEFDLSLSGVTAKGAVGETLTADRIDSINNFEKPATVAPRSYKASANAGKLHLKLPPRSVTVMEVQQ
ncbi:MAG TPA: alpha-L-arabinofuranosidase C-terminal domain-containing protein [Sphingobium sp.]